MVDSDRFDELFIVEMSASNKIEEELWVKGEAHPRKVLYSDGKMELGDGSTPPDVSLERSASGTLTVDGALEASSFAFDSITVASTASSIPNTGITNITSTSTKTFSLDPPTAGIHKELLCTAAGTDVKTVNAGSGINFGGSNVNLTFNAAGEGVVLRGLSTTSWFVVSNVNGVGLST